MKTVTLKELNVEQKREFIALTNVIYPLMEEFSEEAQSRILEATRVFLTRQSIKKEQDQE